MTDTLSVLKVTMVGNVTSFRYPHFTQGFQPTFEMPPPSTIYGHICSAVGEYIDATGWAFGYHFTHDGKFIDYKEHLHQTDPIQPFPIDRELLFRPRLELYLTHLGLEQAFRNPHYAVVLGRSQDLMCYESIEIKTLTLAERAYFEHTLLPLEVAPRLGKPTISATMPRYIYPRRQVIWGNYAILKDAAPYPPLPAFRFAEWDDEGNEGLIFEGGDFPLWVDNETRPYHRDNTLKRAIWFHSLME
jgi:CRISPR-associated protein Cas5t